MASTKLTTNFIDGDVFGADTSTGSKDGVNEITSAVNLNTFSLRQVGMDNIFADYFAYNATTLDSRRRGYNDYNGAWLWYNRGFDTTTTNLSTTLLINTAGSQYRGLVNESGNVTYVSKILHQNRATIVAGALWCTYIVASIEDAFSDGSVGAGWTTTGTVTESGGALNVGPSGGAATARWDTQDYWGTTHEIYLLASHQAGDIQLISFTDGTSDVTLLDSGGANDGRWALDSAQTGFFIRIKILSGNSADIFVDGEYLKRVDFSSLSSSAKLKFSGSSTSSNTITVYLFADSNFTQVSTVTLQLSADNGSNYETFTNGIYRSFTNTGSTLLHKITTVTNAAECIFFFDCKICWTEA